MRERSLTSARVNDLGELLKLIADGISARKCGLSTLHDQSSRSHAFLEFELVSTVCFHSVISVYPSDRVHGVHDVDCFRNCPISAAKSLI